jgi:hypothetical protein
VTFGAYIPLGGALPWPLDLFKDRTMSTNPGLPVEAVDLGDAYGENVPENEFRFPECMQCRVNGLTTKYVRQSDGLHCPVCPEPRPMQVFTVFPAGIEVA